MSASVVFDQVLFFGRKYDEVLQLFALKETDLRGRTTLDCNSGPDAFAGEAHRRGISVTGCDPLYASTADHIRETGRADIAHSVQRSRNDEGLKGNLDVEAFNQPKLDALEEFLSDFENGKREGRYIAGALPRLPFSDNAFDIVLSAHFLFIASHPRFGGMIDTEQFDFAFHQSAIRELLRVSRTEVRIFPFTKIQGGNELHPWAAGIIGELAAEGAAIHIEENTYDQGAFTGHHVLVLQKTGSPVPA